MLRRIEKYHEFKAMCEDAYSLCCNVGEGIRMFSKDLAGFDRNTLQLMIDEMLDMEIKNGTQPPLSDDCVPHFLFFLVFYISLCQFVFLYVPSDI